MRIINTKKMHRECVCKLSDTGFQGVIFRRVKGGFKPLNPMRQGDERERWISKRNRRWIKVFRSIAIEILVQL
jgi:hypothetical protein